MKKQLFLLFILALPGWLSAQSQDLRFGFDASPFVSWLSSDYKRVKSDGVNLGLQVFMNGEFYFRENYAIKTGIGLSFRNGGRLLHLDPGQVFPRSPLSDPNFRNLPAGSSVRYKLQYLEIPVAFRMRTNEIGYTRFFAELPIFTLGLATQSRGNLDLPEGDNENIGKDIHRFNATWGLGGGLEYAITSTTSLIAGLYYHQGMTDVVAETAVNPGKNVLNRLVLRAGVMF